MEDRTVTIDQCEYESLIEYKVKYFTLLHAWKAKSYLAGDGVYHGDISDAFAYVSPRWYEETLKELKKGAKHE